MTLDEFFDELKQRGARFILRGPLIRDPGFDCCPICWLCKEETGMFYLNSSYIRAAEQIGLSFDYAALIVNAADNNSALKPKIRQRLMEFVK